MVRGRRQGNLLAVLVEDGASVNLLLLLFRHDPRPRLGPEQALVAVVRQRATEKFVEVALVDFLQAHDIGVTLSKLGQDDFLTVVPRERSARRVAVQLLGAVLVAQDVVAQRRHRFGRGVAQVVDDDPVSLGRRVGACKSQMSGTRARVGDGAYLVRFRACT